MKPLKMLIKMNIIFSMIMMMSSNNWMMIWLFMEMNLIFFISQMSQSMMFDSMIKYFIIQVLSSSLILYSLFLNFSMKIMFLEMNKIIFMMMLFMKMNLLPFHMWLLNISEFTNWLSLYLLLTLLKLPFFYMYMMILNQNILMMLSITMIISSMNSLNQNMVMKIILFSSINNFCMMLISMCLSMINWMLFFILYSIVMYKLMKIMNKMKITHLNQQKNFTFPLFNNFMFLILTIQGMPPFPMFLPKWLMLNLMTITNMNWLIMLTMLTSIIMLLNYIKIMVFMMLKYKKMLKWTNNKISFTNTNFFLIMMMMSMI